MEDLQIVKSYDGHTLNECMEDIKKILMYFIQNKKKSVLVFDIDDTLIDSENGKLIKETKDLYVFCKKFGIPCFFITARLKEREVIKETLEQLSSYGIHTDESFLKLSPATWRDTFPRISQWKKNIRKKISEELGCKITFSIGDQWGDIINITEKEYNILNDRFYGKPQTLQKSRAVLIRTNDQIGLWGLKLLSHVEKKDFLKNK
jgi:predicted secreted acid phosphatase